MVHLGLLAVEVGRSGRGDGKVRGKKWYSKREILGHICLYVACYDFMLRFNVCSLLLMFFQVGFLGVFLLTFTPYLVHYFSHFCCYVGLLRFVLGWFLFVRGVCLFLCWYQSLFLAFFSGELSGAILSLWVSYVEVLASKPRSSKIVWHVHLFRRKYENLPPMACFDGYLMLLLQQYFKDVSVRNTDRFTKLPTLF